MLPLWETNSSHVLADSMSALPSRKNSYATASSPRLSFNDAGADLTWFSGTNDWPVEDEDNGKCQLVSIGTWSYITGRH